MLYSQRNQTPKAWVFIYKKSHFGRRYNHVTFSGGRYIILYILEEGGGGDFGIREMFYLAIIN